MKIIKKGLALLLTAALVITMVPAASVFAAGGSSDGWRRFLGNRH